MKVKLIAVLDECSGVYDGPVPVQNEKVALRNFANMCKQPESPIAKNPSDFSIWLVGEWNDADATIVSEGKKCLAYAIDLITPDEEA
jgi:hypothetical protein